MTRQTKFNVRFNTPKIQSKEICGIPCTIHRIPAHKAPLIVQTLLADVGDIVGSLLSKDGGLDDLANKIHGDEAEQTASAASWMGNIRKFLTSAGVIGLAARIRSKDMLNVEWYLEHLLLGNLVISNMTVERLDQFDELGADVSVLWELIQYALEVNFSPFFPGLNTDDGSKQNQSEPQRPREAPASEPILMSSSLREETARVGH